MIGWLVSFLINLVAVLFVCLIVLSPYLILKEFVRSYLYRRHGINYYTNEEREKMGIQDTLRVVEPEVLPKEDVDADFDQIILDLQQISFKQSVPKITSRYNRNRRNRRRRYRRS